MNTARRCRVGYMLADPAFDLSRHEGGRVQLERVVHCLREIGHEVSFVAVQSGEVVLTDTGFGLQQFFEAASGADTADRAGDASTPLSGELLRFARENGFPVSELTTSNLAFRAGRRVFRRCDLVHTRLSPFDVGGLMCARVLQIPLVVEVDGAPIVGGGHVSPELLHHGSECLARASASRTLDDAEAVITPSTALRDLLVSDWAVEPEKVVVLQNVAPAPPPTSSETVQRLRRDYELGAGPVLIFVGAAPSYHGLALLLEALVAVKALHPEATVLVAGDGPSPREMVERAASLDLSASVRFIGGVGPERLSQLLAVAEVAVAPSPPRTSECPFSPAIVEYMAAGKAIVASRSGQAAEILSDEETALLVESDSRDELAQAIGRLLDDGELRRRLGDRARRRTEQEHTWTRYVRELTAIYENVLSSAR